jgi:hypothetical protein
MKDSWKFEITDEVENDDGTWTLTFDVDDEFVVWFKEWQGLKRWSQKRFQKVMLKVIMEAVEREEENENLAHQRHPLPT